jgi:hypothetical protein
MIKNRIAALLTGLVVALVAVPASTTKAQDTSGQTQLSEQQQAEETARKEKAIVLLEQIISESQALRLPENRIRIQIFSADLLWERNEARARTLFANAAAGISDLMRSSSSASEEDRQYYEQIQAPSQLRRELLFRVARRDAALALQFLQATRPPTSSSSPSNARGGRRFDSEDNLEQMLLMQIAASDPKAALKYAEEMMDKGQYPVTLATTLSRLQRQDKEAAAKLTERIVSRLQAENLTANRDAINLAFTLLQAGPRATSTDAAKTIPQNSFQMLSESAYRDLLEATIASGLKATPSTAATARGSNNPRRQRGGEQQAQTALSDAQNEQINARTLLIRLQMLLPQVDQYLPARSQALRQKLSEVGMSSSSSNSQRPDMSQLGSLMQQNTSESLSAAAETAPPGLQSRLYQQAALRAVDEGNTERALEIANEHLDSGTRNVVLQNVSFKQLTLKAQAGKMEEVRQALSSLPSEQERLTLLLQLAAATQKENPKQALQFMNEARNLVSRRAANYQQLEDQLRVAHAYAALDAGRSFEIMEQGINLLNELLPAAAMLSGFDVNIFKDGEMPMQGGSALSSMVTRYGQELSFLAKSDFERSLLTADKFQLPESRILARLSIAQGVLGSPAAQNFENNFGIRSFNQSAPFRRGQ